MRKICLVMLLWFVFLFPTKLLAASQITYIGNLADSNVTLDIEGTQVSTYQAFDKIYVAAGDLKAAGYYVSYSPSEKMVIIDAQQLTPATPTSISLLHKAFSLYDGPIYVGAFKSHGIIADNRVLVPIDALRSIWDIHVIDNIYYLYPCPPSPVTCDAFLATNLSDSHIVATVTDIYWEKDLITTSNVYYLAPYETLPRTPSSPDAKYISTVVNSAIGENINYTSLNLFGQDHAALFNKIYGPIPEITSDIGDPIDSETWLWAESTVNSKNLTSETAYLVWTHLPSQRTYIFTREGNSWTLIKHFICSTGTASSPTPTGLFKLTQKVPSFGQNKGYCCKNAFGFIGTSYLYHSIIFDRTGTYLLEGKGVLGTPASNGCIRFSVEHSEWFYNTLLPNTTVWIS